MIKKKLIIGTANFGQKYGIANSSVNFKSLINILHFAKIQKLENFDTSTMYKNNENFLSNLNFNSKINLKIIPNKKWSNLNHVFDIFKNIKTNKKFTINSVMIHDAKFLFSPKGKKIFKNLLVLKKKNFFNKIGVSLYDFEDLNYILKNFRINIVQCPFSILDRRLIDNEWLKLLKLKNIEVHARSVYLQGLLTNKKLIKNNYFKKWHPIFKKWFKDIREHDFSPSDICLSYVLNHKIDKIVVGINDIDHLKSIINFKKVKNLKNFDYIKNDNINLYDTRKWLHLWLK